MRLSTSPKGRSRSAHEFATTFALFVGVLLLSPQATAAECSDANEDGVCLDAGTFQWCEDGELKSAKCPNGKVCVADNPFYDGAGCVATDETACGEISAEGECTTANGVVWCDEGVPMVFPCGEDSVCGWDEDNGEYDCLPRSNMTNGADSENSPGLDSTSSDDEEDTSTDEPNTEPEPVDVGPSEDSDDADQADPDDTANQNMTPSVTPTEVDTTRETEVPEDSTGCQTSRSASDFLMALLGAALWLIARRRDDGTATIA
jgi:hypothetical protein